MTPELENLASAQDGVFTTREAVACGLGRADLAAGCRRGDLVHLGRGAYALSRVWPTDEVARHAVRSVAALRVYPDARLVGVSALVAQGAPVWGVPLARVDLARGVRQQKCTQSYRIRPWSAVLRTDDSSEEEHVVAAAVVQAALDVGALPAVVSADYLIHEGQLSPQTLVQVAETVRGWAGSSRVRSLLAWVDGKSESVGETRTRILLRTIGLGCIAQFPIADAGGVFARGDLLIEGTNVLLEFDGKVKYASGDPSVLWREKVREDRIRRAGYVVIRVTWADLENPARLIRRIRGVLRQQGYAIA